MGNPGKAYERTRHNAGFLLLEELRSSFGLPGFKAIDRFLGEYSEGKVLGTELMLFRPLTYMNRSGEAIRPLVNYFRLDPARILVVHDDLDIPIGRIRFSYERGSGGHKGVESIIEYLGTRAFPRLRLGIGRPHKGVSGTQYVLQPFLEEERERFKKVLSLAREGIVCFLEDGILAAMNSFNGRKIEE